MNDKLRDEIKQLVREELIKSITRMSVVALGDLQFQNQRELARVLVKRKSD